MVVKSKVLKTRNLPVDGKLIDHCNAKPYLFILLAISIGALLLMTRFYLIGFVILCFFLYYLIFVKDVTLIEFYDKYAVFYFNNAENECFLLFWEDVEKWQVHSSRKDFDQVEVTLRNQQVVSLKCLERKKLERYLTTYTNANTETVMSKQHA